MFIIVKSKRMKKVEYIPGDIVKIEYGEATGKIGFVTNTFLRRKGCYNLVVFIGKGFQGSSKEDWIQTYNDEVSPIPLSTEILEKNGWEHNDDVYFKEYPHRKLVVMDGNAYIINNSCSLFLCKVEFVHQLQHLLFGLGLNSEMEV